MSRPILRDDLHPKNTISYFFREAVRRIWVSKRSSFVAVAMICVSLMIVGAFLLIAENLERAAATAEGRSRVSVFLDPEATPQQVAAVGAALAANPHLAARHFVSKDEAMQRFRAYFPNLSGIVGELGENPLPASFECDVPPAVVQSPAFQREAAMVRALPGVEQVQFDWEWVERLKRLINLVNVVGIVAGGLLAIAAAFTIANVIRLTMMLYREEIEIMRLVGATERIIRGPFLIEGVLQGLLGAIAAVLLLVGVYFGARRFLVPGNSIVFGFLFNGFLPWPKIAALIGGGMLAGYLGSWMSVRESGGEVV
jgi:cell division transport system permease protein